MDSFNTGCQGVRFSRKMGGARLGSPPSKQASNSNLPFFTPPLCSDGSGMNLETFPTKGFFSAPPEERSVSLLSEPGETASFPVAMMTSKIVTAVKIALCTFNLVSCIYLKMAADVEVRDSLMQRTLY